MPLKCINRNLLNGFISEWTERSNPSNLQLVNGRHCSVSSSTFGQSQFAAAALTEGEMKE